MKKILETERLILRETTDEDFDAFKLIIKGHRGQDVEESYIKRWIDWSKSSYEQNGFGLWTVIYKDSGEVIGSCGLSMQMIDDEYRPEIGYHLRKDYHRQGLGKEVTRAIKDYVFNHFDFDELYSYMNYDNVASYKTAEANGMTFLHLYTTKYGEVCKVYSITRNKWLEDK